MNTRLMKKLLITGASGFLGWNIFQRAKSNWTVFGTFFSHSLNAENIILRKVNLTLFHDLKQLFQEIHPDAIIHTAAVTDPNICQQYRTETGKINIDVPVNIAGLCSDRSIPCLFTSTDLVFDGLNPPYAEDDDPSPVSIYGEQKILAELGMKERYSDTVICRMPLMFGDPGPVAKSFVQPLIQSMKSGIHVPLFIDEFRTPISGRDAASGIMLALNRQPEIIHFGGPERISRYEFGKRLSDIFDIPDANIIPCRQKDANMPAPRPPDVSLDSSKAMALGFRANSLTNELEYLKGLV